MNQHNCIYLEHWALPQANEHTDIENQPGEYLELQDLMEPLNEDDALVV